MQFVHLVRGGERVVDDQARGRVRDARRPHRGDRRRRRALVPAQRARTTRRSSSTSTWPRSQSAENPVYYVQYAHARIASVLRKAGEARVEPALARRAGAGVDAAPVRARAGRRSCWRGPARSPRRPSAARRHRHRHLRAGARPGLHRVLPRLPGRRRRARGARVLPARAGRRVAADDRARAGPARGRRRRRCRRTRPGGEVRCGCSPRGLAPAAVGEAQRSWSSAGRGRSRSAKAAARRPTASSTVARTRRSTVRAARREHRRRQHALAQAQDRDDHRGERPRAGRRRAGPARRRGPRRGGRPALRDGQAARAQRRGGVLGGDEAPQVLVPLGVAQPPPALAAEQGVAVGQDACSAAMIVGPAGARRSRDQRAEDLVGAVEEQLLLAGK